jgi:hypothetical protein
MDHVPPLKNSPSDEYIRGAADTYAKCISKLERSNCLPLILDVAQEVGITKERLKSAGVERETIATIAEAYVSFD